MSILPQLQEFKDSLPELRYLAVYDSLTQVWIWIYDYLGDALLTPEEALLKMPQSFLLENFVSEIVHYERLIEYNLRFGSKVISCISERKNINLKLIEIWLSKQSELILGLDIPAQPTPADLKPKAIATKSRARSKSETGAKTKSVDKPIAAAKGNSAQKKKAADPSIISTQPAADWLQLRFPGAVQLKNLRRRKQMMSFLIRDSSTKAKYLARVFPATCFKAESWQKWSADCADPTGLFDYKLADSQPGFTMLRRPWLNVVSLRELVGKLGKISLNRSVLLLSKIHEPLASYHAQNRSHANLQPDNIFFDTDHHVILLDAGLTKMNKRFKTQPHVSELYAGDPLFLAPEQILKQEHGPSVDFFSLGVLQLYMLMGAEPFATLSAHDSVEERVKEMHKLARLELKETVSPDVLDKILSLIAVVPDERPDDLSDLLTDVTEK